MRGLFIVVSILRSDRTWDFLPALYPITLKKQSERICRGKKSSFLKVGKRICEIFRSTRRAKGKRSLLIDLSTIMLMVDWVVWGDVSFLSECSARESSKHFLHFHSVHANGTWKYEISLFIKSAMNGAKWKVKGDSAANGDSTTQFTRKCKSICRPVCSPKSDGNSKNIFFIIHRWQWLR